MSFKVQNLLTPNSDIFKKDSLYDITKNREFVLEVCVKVVVKLFDLQHTYVPRI